ncbi:ARM repeat-containing protein [Paraphaeosphaeria sporulosa]|uniref:ARM repeat-containing protein n=1 Tax=Paraphaeosphaeria sporulosa TaxID=1460663 RepID=A0A177D0Y9_9PLEO|nr:ARM repeat-containing protein [Paraphaeosphaeria sporulosa]OAG12790.1 ARM repeat-containing protein [Paraphaeosphaeria sporulosa]
MAGIKRKSAAAAQPEVKSKSKKVKTEKPAKRSSDKDAVKLSKSSKKSKRKDDSDDLMESDTSEVENGFYGFSASKDEDAPMADEADDGFVGEELEAALDNDTVKEKKKSKKDKDGKSENKKEKKASKESGAAEEKSSALAGLNANSSREAHAKQKALAKERKAARPNAEVMEQLKELWEKLRLKANVSAEERKDLIDRTFELVTGRIKEFVFKHDTVRVIQSALKYTHSMDQRRIIAQELKGEFKGLAEGKYAKFLIAKLLEKGDAEIRGLIIQEFYGNVRRLINHPEASWILDDTYRQVATPAQKARLLREWYGPEFSIKGLGDDKDVDNSDLNAILEKSPEKRKPIMDYLEQQINQLIQKKQTGFTMLHDAMLQYFLTCKPNTTEASDFLDHLKPDPTLKEGEEADNIDLLKNLAFTKPGSRLVSLAFAYGAAKDRKILLRPYKDTIETMAYDANAHNVLLAALAVTDDTKLTSKSIFGELLPAVGSDQLAEKIQNLSNDARARCVLLYPFASDSKWLLDEETRGRLAEVYKVREITSKKDANIRNQELAKAIEPQLLAAVSQNAEYLAQSYQGLQLIGEVLVGAPEVEPKVRQEALKKVAGLSRQIIDGGGFITSHGKNMLKTLVQGGKFDPKTKKVVPVDPPLGFADLFWSQIKGDLMTWATGEGAFVIVGLVESENFGHKDEVIQALKKGRKQLQEAAGPARDAKTPKPKKGAAPQSRGNAGARILLEKL